MQHRNWIKSASQRLSALEDKNDDGEGNTTGQYFLWNVQPLSNENDAVEWEDMLRLKRVPGKEGLGFVNFFGTMDQVEAQLRRDDPYFYSIQFNRSDGVWGENDGFDDNYRLVCDDPDWANGRQRYPKHNK